MGMDWELVEVKQNRYIEYHFRGRDLQKVEGTRRAIIISGDVMVEVKSFKY